MANWYRVSVPASLAAAGLEALRASPLVTFASRAPEPVPPPVTPDFSPQQLYLDLAPTGIGAEYSLGDPRTRGAGVTIVTAFTIAHSATLALAATGTVVLPTQPVEVAIALSIVVAGLLNLLPRLSGWRLPLAFGFGLVHGFGFANVLGELDLSGASMAPLLAGFNISVELAQLGIVVLVLPPIYLARRARWYSDGVLPLGSCALGAAYEGIYRIPRNADGIRPKRLDLLFDCLDNEVRRCPACGQKRLPIGAIIIHLNDHHQWTREQIAHWLRDDANARAAASKG